LERFLSLAEEAKYNAAREIAIVFIVHFQDLFKCCEVDSIARFVKE
jgi:hypothetical protein